MDVVSHPDALTPWELRNGRWYKREDYHRNAYGVNGAKYRACRHMMVRAHERGFRHVVSAQSVHSPQSAIVATLAEELGMDCTLVLGSSSPDTAVRHPNVGIAVGAGAVLDTTCRVAYNGVLQPYAARLAEELGAWHLPYAISMPDDASPTDLREFMSVGGYQVLNLPRSLETLVIPFGSGNTAAGILYGLHTHGHSKLQRVVLVGIGPDRLHWLVERLLSVGLNLTPRGVELQHLGLHGWYADYSDRMPETVDEIVMHPTYEGKVVRFLGGAGKGGLDWWDARDSKVGLWIVGGPVG